MLNLHQPWEGGTGSHLEPPVTLTATQLGRILLLSTEDGDEAVGGGTDRPQFASFLRATSVHLYMEATDP